VWASAPPRSVSVSLAERHDAFLFDLDGVLYRGREAIPHAAEALTGLREMGRAIGFVTNNSARSPRAVVERLRRVGITASPDEVETSALTTARILAARGVTTAFIVGEAGLREALEEAGITVVDGEPHAVEAVVVGFDRTADYAKLRIASVLVETGAALLATNADASFPAADGHAWPGAGALLATVTTTTGADPEVIGKPFPPILEAALARVGGTRPLLIGDRLDTDIEGASTVGWDSLLVLTGISTREEARAWPHPPTYVGEDLRVLTDPDPDRGADPARG
jgi:glycerol-1-phosphatase